MFCEKCNKSFSNIGNLNRHLKIKHTEDVEYVCKCNKHFKNAQSLNAHFRWCLIHRDGKEVIPSPNKGKISPHRGKKLEEIVEDAEATRKRKRVSAQNRKPPSALSRQRMSESRLRAIERSKHVKWFIVNGVKVQGEWEKRVAEILVDLGLTFSRARLKYDECRSYTPDFFVHELNCFIEVKGWMRDTDIEKYQKVLKEYPNLVFKVIHGRKELKDFEFQKKIQNLRNLRDAIAVPS